MLFVKKRKPDPRIASSSEIRAVSWDMGGPVQLPRFPAWGIEVPQFLAGNLGGSLFFRAMSASSEMASRFPAPLQTAKKLGFQSSWFCQWSCKEKVAFVPHCL